MTDKKTPKSGFVTRSVYQKVCEENKKLIKDIRALVNQENGAVRIPVIIKWRTKFYKEKLLNQELTSIAKQYLKEHPEYDITSPWFKSLKKGTK